MTKRVSPTAGILAIFLASLLSYSAEPTFTNSPYINPRIIQDLSCWISDKGDQVVAINLPDSQHSNRYFGEAKVREIKSQFPVIYCEETRIEAGQTNTTSFSYQWRGRTKSGVEVLVTCSDGGGSDVFKSVLLLKFEEDLGLELRGGEVRSKKRWLIKKLGELPLRDRGVRIEGDAVFVDGKTKAESFKINLGKAGFLR